MTNLTDLEPYINFTDFEQLILWVVIAGFCCVIFSLAVLASKR